MVSLALVSKRQIYCTGDDSYAWGYWCFSYQSRWHRWGRWLLLGLVLATALVAGVCFLIWWIYRRRNRQAQAQAQAQAAQPTQPQCQGQCQQSYTPEPQYNQQNMAEAGNDYAPPNGPPPASAAAPESGTEFMPPIGPPPVKYESYP